MGAHRIELACGICRIGHEGLLFGGWQERAATGAIACGLDPSASRLFLTAHTFVIWLWFTE
jgi:hypothetical protein